MTQLVITLFIVALLAPTQAADFTAGLRAYLRGDYAAALGEFRPLAKQGDTLAQFYLGRMHDDGEGVPEDDAEAVRWYRLAAEQGHAWAQFDLGAMYAFGEGVPQDDARAYAWFNVAAAQGNTGAAEARDRVAGRLTPEALVRAQTLAREYLARLCTK